MATVKGMSKLGFKELLPRLVDVLGLCQGGCSEPSGFWVLASLGDTFKEVRRNNKTSVVGHG